MGSKKGSTWKNRQINKLNKIEKDILKMDWRIVIVEGIATRYLVNRLGDVISLKHEQLLSASIDKKGYKYITIFVHDIDKTYKKYSYSISRLVATTFIPNPENKPCVNHINGIKTDNRVENLEWVTYSENIKHAYDTGLKLIDNITGSKNPSHKYKNEEIERVCQLLVSGHTAPEISKLTGITASTIWDIKSKSTWKCISDKYNLPDPKTRHDPFEIKFKDIVIKLISEGFSTNEIMEIAGMPMTGGSRGYINRLKRQFR